MTLVLFPSNFGIRRFFPEKNEGQILELHVYASEKMLGAWTVKRDAIAYGAAASFFPGITP